MKSKDEIMKEKIESYKTDWKDEQTLEDYNVVEKMCPKVKKRIKRVLEAEGIHKYSVEYNINEGGVMFTISEPDKMKKNIPIDWKELLKKKPKHTGEVLGNLYLGKVEEFFGKNGTRL